MPTPEPHNLVHPRFFPELGREEGAGTRSQEAEIAGSLGSGPSRCPVRRRFTEKWRQYPFPQSHTPQSQTPPESGQTFTSQPRQLTLHQGMTP